ncbi:MAG: hypothetical protein R2794_07825 [Chitinophagales bacterium]
MRKSIWATSRGSLVNTKNNPYGIGINMWFAGFISGTLTLGNNGIIKPAIQVALF